MSPPLRFIPKIIRFLGYVPPAKQPQSFGEKIVNHGRLSGITQKELANRLGVDPSTLRRWESDKSRPLKRHLERLNVFLGSMD